MIDIIYQIFYLIFFFKQDKLQIILFCILAITKIERKKAIEFYEPERKANERKHAFLRSINLDEIDTKTKPKIKNSQSKKIFQNENAKSSNFDFNDQYAPNRAFFNSIKEFSYFDWSKVKLYRNDNINEGLNKSVSSSKSKTFGEDEFLNDNIIKDLPQVITIRFT